MPIKDYSIVVVVVFFLGLVWGPAATAQAVEYRLGQGIQIGVVNLSGYLNLVGKGPRHGEAEVEIDDLALFASARVNHWLQPFLEVEFSGQPFWDERRGVFWPDRGRWLLERAYNDVVLQDGWQLRIGKILSPVGQWNLIHAAPLVMTTKRPLTTFRNFSVFSSGVALMGGPEGNFTLYYQPWGELAPLPKRFSPRRYRQLAGAYWVVGDALTQWLGFGIQAGERRPRHHWQTLFSMDGGGTWNRVSLQFQTTYNRLYGDRAAHRTRNEWGGYLQLAWRFHRDWSFVTRFEGYRDRDASSAQRNQLVGIVFHPHPAVKWKLEYLWIQGPRLGGHEGIFGSIAVLF